MGGDDNKGGELNKATGLPKMDEEERDKGSSQGTKAVIFAPIIFSAIGFGIAFAVYKCGSTATYDAKIASVVSYGMAYAYASAWVFSRMVQVLNMYPMIYKGRVMRGKSGNLRANMFIYKLVGDKAPENAVVLNEDGDVGCYNRANRSLNHFIENAGGMILSIGLNSFVFAFPSFICVIIFAIGRMWHMSGYAKGGYGSHGIGFGLSAIATEAMTGMLLLVALKGMAIF